jgi:hypothetical protein
MKMIIALSCLSLSAACVGNVSGEIDGKGVAPMWSGIMGDKETQIPLLGGDIQNVIATWYSYGDSCKHYEALDGENADDQEDYIKANLPQDYWTLSLNASDDDKGDLEQLKQDLSDDDFLFITICHTTDYPEARNGFLEQDQECYSANDGEVEMQWVEGESVRLTGTELEFDDNDGDDAGTVGFSGSASFCEDLDDNL